MFQAPLAYKFVIIAAMMSQVNYYAPRLQLPIDVPLKKQDIRFLNVGPPIIFVNRFTNNTASDRFLLDSGIYETHSTNLYYYGDGRIDVKNYSFSFHGNRLYSITKLEADGKDSFGIPLLKLDEGQNSLMERASLMKYTVNTNDLYQMATNYLVALGIDRQAFEETNTLAVEQGEFHSKRGLVPSPLIYAYWGKPELRGPHFNGFSFEISAVSGELLEINFGKALTSPLIKDADKLLAISDEEFLKYSAEERSNLVARFSTVTFRASTNNSLSQTNVPAATNVPEKQ